MNGGVTRGFAMTQFPEDKHVHDASAQAFIDRGHGYVRFEFEGKIKTYRLPLLAFARLARDIQSSMRRQDPQTGQDFPANDQ